jgi:hypothetical protein
MSVTDERPGGWVRVLHLGHDAWLGLLGDGLLGDGLFVGDLVGPKREVDPSEPTGLLACLERHYFVIVAELQDREFELSLLPGTLMGRVPLAGIPHAAVASRSGYWGRPGARLAW